MSLKTEDRLRCVDENWDIGLVRYCVVRHADPFTFVQEYAINYLYLPGVVETNVSVLDLGNIGFGTAYNLMGAVKSTLKTMQNHYVHS